MKVMVLGTGAVGGYYGGLLARAGHQVSCLARGDTLAAIRERGVQVRTPEGAFRADVMAADQVEALPAADFAILAVKSYSLDDIGAAVRRCAEQGAVVVPLLNGAETTERLDQLGVSRGAIIGGFTRVSAVRLGPGVVERRSPFQEVVIGELDGRPSERVDQIAAAFRDGGVDGRASDRIQLELWQKFVFIVTLVAACGLARSPVGPLRAHRLGRRIFQRAAEEVAAVARARGIALPESDVARVMAVIDGLPPGLKPSFLTDLESGGPTELDILSGTVSRFGELAGVPTPIHDTAALALAQPDSSSARFPPMR